MLDTSFKRQLGTCAVIATALIGSSLTTACTSRHVTGGLLGGAVVGGAYEYQNKKAIRHLERARAHGRISEREYQRRREEIEDRSIIY